MEDISYYDFENFRLDVVNEQLIKGTKSIPLTHKAFKTLLILVQNNGQLVKKEDIINKIWHDSFVEEANLTQHIYVLRKTLGNNKFGKPFIETVPKRGYLFTSDVQQIKKSIQKFVAFDTIPNNFHQDDSVLNEDILFLKSDLHNTDDANLHQTNPNLAITASKTSKLKPFWLILAFAAMLTVGLFLYQVRSNQISAGSSVKSIAILPFKPIGEESSNAKLGFGMADAVITRLSKFQKIPIRPTSAVFRFTEQNFDPIKAGKELGVDSVLEGTVQREGELVRVSVRLIKVNDGTTLWADTFDEKFTHIFALQDSISSKVAKALSFNLSSNQEEQITVQTTSNTDAYQAYQLGIYFWNKRTKEDLEKAVSYFQKAVQIDENYALAYAMLADSYNMLFYYGFAEDKKETIEKADEAAKKALELNDSLPETHIAISYIQIAKYKDLDSALKSLERAIQLSPYNPTARIRYGWQLLRLGEMDKALEQMKIAQTNDPLSQVSNSALCSMLLLKRNYPEALKYSEKAVELQPNAPMVKLQLASVYFLNGRTDEAVSILKEESQKPYTKYDSIAGLAFIYAKTGKTKEAEELFLQLKNNKVNLSQYSDLALIAFTLGKKQEAMGFFKMMVEKNKQIPLSIISDPYWEEVFKDEEFKKLIPPAKQS